MAGSRKTGDPSPESLARAQRQRLAAEEGAKSMAEFEQKALAVRKNMERLRLLREAKEAEQAAQAKANAPQVSTKGTSKRKTRAAQ